MTKALSIVESRRVLLFELLLCVDADGTNVLKMPLLIVEPKQKLIPSAPDYRPTGNYGQPWKQKPGRGGAHQGLSRRRTPIACIKLGGAFSD